MAQVAPRVNREGWMHFLQLKACAYGMGQVVGEWLVGIPRDRPPIRHSEDFKALRSRVPSPQILRRGSRLHVVQRGGVYTKDPMK